MSIVGSPATASSARIASIWPTDWRAHSSFMERRLSDTQPRVQRVAERIPKQVEGEYRRAEGEARRDR